MSESTRADACGSVVVRFHRETKFKDRSRKEKAAKSEYIIPETRTIARALRFCCSWRNREKWWCGALIAMQKRQFGLKDLYLKGATIFVVGMYVAQMAPICRGSRKRRPGSSMMGNTTC